MSSTHLTSAELYANHSERTTIAIGFGIALPIVAVLLRLCARKIQGIMIGADDYMIIVAAVLTIGNSCVPILANKGGNGRHQETLSHQELKDYFLYKDEAAIQILMLWQSLFIFEQTFGAAVCAVKFSVLLLYRRIFITRSFKISTTVIAILVTLWVIVKNLVGAFQCTPVRKAWIKSTPGHCINFIDLVLGAQAFNVVFDIVILILPMRAVYKLHLPLHKKLGVMAIFAVGTFTIVVAIIRIAVIASEVIEHGPTLPDITWFTSKFSWTIMDPAVGCFVACMPTWSPLIKPLARIGEYASLLQSTFARSIFTRSSNPSRNITTPGASNEQNFYLANYKRPTTREVTIGRQSGSFNSQQELNPIRGPKDVLVKKEFTREEYNI
ncbi:Satratoxin biosynthesis SC1 cluster protein 4 [Lachnellula arida]|uniref:Satratoxin biosynthesis SC1 cluster protein 4 n=1 Tax=Lachnellula arida TaxID=1316785 RepID=A0A8T9B1R9_9HELO|nr:Satratoxin biosynthesis SC1 cluster protein 4 [Lachnellula arida]